MGVPEAIIEAVGLHAGGSEAVMTDQIRTTGTLPATAPRCHAHIADAIRRATIALVADAVAQRAQAPATPACSFFTPLSAGLRLRMCSPEFFPGTDERVPLILTDWEACRLLRLDAGHGDDRAKPLRALRRFVESGRLVPVRIGKFNRYRRADILRLAGGAAPPEN